jgi:hypothetical protein
MPSILRVLDALTQTHEVELLERHGSRFLLQSPSPIAPGTAVQLRLEGELLLGEIGVSVPRGGHFEVGMRAKEVLLDSWHPHPDWGARDSEESVMGSLSALNAHLEFYEEQRRATGNVVQDNLRKAS